MIHAKYLIQHPRLMTASVACLGVAACFFAAGCQSMNGRWRSLTGGLDASAEDDWAPPRANSLTAASPSARKSWKGTSTASQSASSSASPTAAKSPAANGSTATSATPAIQAGTDQTSQPMAKGDSPSAQVGLESTDQQEVDLEGAIAALPPQLQDLAKQQLAAIAAKNQAAGTAKSKSAPPEGVVAAPEPSADKRGKADKLETKVAVSSRLSDQSLTTETTPATEVGEPAAAVQRPITSAEQPLPEALATAATQPLSATLDQPVVPASATMRRPSAADTPLTASWNSSVGQAIEQLKEQIANASGLDENLRLSQEISLRLLSLADRKLEAAMEPIPGLTSNEQDYFRHQLQALHEAGNPDAMPVKSRRWSLVMNSQRAATQKLAAASNLEVRSLAFCTDVQGYGVITKFPAYTFKADQELLLYCELENVLAEAVKGGFETQLQGTYELLDDSGRRVADQLLPMEREICQNHRRDYFIIYHIYMPAQIEPGKYQMRVTIEDMKARKFGQATVDFQVQP
jgi:hypothetical protein